MSLVVFTMAEHLAATFCMALYVVPIMKLCSVEFLTKGKVLVINVTLVPSVGM